MFHLKQTNLRCGCVILSVFAMHMVSLPAFDHYDPLAYINIFQRHPSEGQYRNPIQKILSRRVTGDPKGLLKLHP
jgi:hypothetical protein